MTPLGRSGSCPSRAITNWVDAGQGTGRITHVPNGKVFQESAAYHTAGFNFIWNELPVAVTLESNWEKAKQVLDEIAPRHSVLNTEDDIDFTYPTTRFFDNAHERRRGTRPEPS